jgi:RimJ/RimL family protein N-acetyltransferase
MFAEIKTERLGIRSLQLTDAQRIFQYRTHPNVSRFQSWGTASPEVIHAYIEKLSVTTHGTPGLWYQLGITLRPDTRLIGDCSFRVLDTDERQAEIGIALAPEFQGQGFAGEALQALLEYLFITLGKHRVFGSVDPRNLSSVKLLRRVGMRQEAHFIKSFWFRGEWVDDLIFAILASEWSTRRVAPSG